MTVSPSARPLYQSGFGSKFILPVSGLTITLLPFVAPVTVVSPELEIDLVTPSKVTAVIVVNDS